MKPQNSEFGMPSKNFPGNKITPKGLRPEKEKVQKFLNATKRPTTVKQVKRLFGFTLFFPSFLPNLAQNLMLWYELLRKDIKFLLQDEHVNCFDNIKKDLLKATETTSRLAKPGQQCVILCDASYYSSGFVLMIED